ERSTDEGLDDEPGEKEPGIGVRLDRTWGRRRRRAGGREIEQVVRREAPPTVAVQDGVHDRRLEEVVRQPAGVVEELTEREAGGVPVALRVVEAPENVVAEVR